AFSRSPATTSSGALLISWPRFRLAYAATGAGGTDIKAGPVSPSAARPPVALSADATASAIAPRAIAPTSARRPFVEKLCVGNKGASRQRNPGATCAAAGRKSRLRVRRSELRLHRAFTRWPLQHRASGTRLLQAPVKARSSLIDLRLLAIRDSTLAIMDSTSE